MVGTRPRIGRVQGVLDLTSHAADYPLEAIQWMVGPPPATVVDAGAGTGKLTRVLLSAGYEVIAVEPSGRR